MPNSYRAVSALAVLTVLGKSGAALAADCDAAFRASLQRADAHIASMPVSKPGQARVLDRDGQEHTAGAVRRMAVLLRLAEQACGRGDAVAAADYLDEIQGSAVTATREVPKSD